MHSLGPLARAQPVSLASGKQSSPWDSLDAWVVQPQGFLSFLLKQESSPQDQAVTLSYGTASDFCFVFILAHNSQGFYDQLMLFFYLKRRVIV